MIPSEKHGNGRKNLRSLIVLVMLVLGTFVTMGVALAGAPTGKQLAPGSAANSNTTFTSAPGADADQGGSEAPQVPMSYQLDDGSRERVLGFGNNALTIGYAALYLNRFTPLTGDFPITLDSISIQWPSTTAAKTELMGKQVKLLVYQDSDGDDNPANAVKLEEQIVTIGMTTTFETYPVNVQVLGPGDIYVGFETYFEDQHITPFVLPASVDTDTNKLRSWVFAEDSGNPPDLNNLGNNDYQLKLNDIGLPGNLLIRASGLTQHPDNTGCSAQIMAPAPQEAANSSVASKPSAGGNARFDARGGANRSKQGGSAPAANTLTDTFVLDDGTYEHVVRFGSDNLDTSYAAIWLNRFTPPLATHYPFTVRTISILWPNPDRSYVDLLNKQVTLLVYQDSDGDGDPADATLLYQELTTVPSADLFVDYSVNVTVPGPGDIYVGFESTFAKSHPVPAAGPAAIDDSSGSKGRSYAYGMQEVDAMPRDPNKEDLGANTIGGRMDDLGLPGNFLIRASGLANTVACTATPTVTSTSTATETATETATSTETSISTSTNTAVATSTSTVVPSATATACSIHFADVPPSHTFYTFVRCLACRGIVTGYECGEPGEACNGSNDPYYRPGANVTRGQLSKIIANSAGLNDAIAEGQQQFADVQPGDPFYVFVERLAETGAIAGYPCGELGPDEPCDGLNRPYFRPNNPATRGQISKIVSIAAGFEEDVPAEQQTFTDVPTDSPFWVFIERLAARDIISGYGEASRCPETGAPCFRYNDLTTRGQMAKIAANAFFPNCQTPARP